MEDLLPPNDVLIDSAQRQVVAAVCEKYEQTGVVLQIPVGGGKTRIALAIAFVRARKGTVAAKKDSTTVVAATENVPMGIAVVIVPSSIMEQWRTEISVCFPTFHFRSFVFHGTERKNVQGLKEFVYHLSSTDIGLRFFITTKETLLSLHKTKRNNPIVHHLVMGVIARNAVAVIIDEIHVGLRNHENCLNRFLRRFKMMKIGLSATPVVNCREDLYALKLVLFGQEPCARFLDNSKLSDSAYARLREQLIIERTRQELNIESAELRKRVVYIEMGSLEHRVYASQLSLLKRALDDLVRGSQMDPMARKQARIRYFQSILRLRMSNLYIHLQDITMLISARRHQRTTALIDIDLEMDIDVELENNDTTNELTAVETQRLPLEEEIRELVQTLPVTARLQGMLRFFESRLTSKKKVLLFTEFPSFFHIVRRFLPEDRTAFLHGEMSIPDRNHEVDRFKSTSSCGLFFISLNAGGVGLNLKEADEVVFLDHPMNPAKIEQAIGRANRRNRSIPFIDVTYLASYADTFITRYTTHRTKDKLSDRRPSSTSKSITSEEETSYARSVLRYTDMYGSPQYTRLSETCPFSFETDYQTRVEQLEKKLFDVLSSSESATMASGSKLRVPKRKMVLDMRSSSKQSKQ